MKAIVIDEPWITLILSRQKTWEMRKNGCSYRGLVALIRKGSGQVVGTANIVGSLPPLTTAEAYASAEDRHRIPPERQARARLDGWDTPWVMTDVKPLAKPVNYRHPYGAVIWVNLDADVAASVAVHAGNSTDVPFPALAATPQAASSPGMHQPRAVEGASGSGDSRVVTITGGNLRNNHIYLPLEFFPADAIGGKNKREAAPQQLSVIFEPGQTVHADIDGTKKILRSRAPIGEFFARAAIAEGDKVVIRRLTSYAYSIAKHVG